MKTLKTKEKSYIFEDISQFAGLAVLDIKISVNL